MNSLYDLINKLQKIEEGGWDINDPDAGKKQQALNQQVQANQGTAPPTTFTPNYFHKNNFGARFPLMMTAPGVFWHEATPTPGENGYQRGGAGAGKTIQRWYGNTESRDAASPASVDGKIVNGKYIDFPEGTTWKTDLASMAQTQQGIDATKASLAATDQAQADLRKQMAQPFAGAKLPNAGSVSPAPAPEAPPASTYNAASDSQAAYANMPNNGLPASNAAPAADSGNPEVQKKIDRIKQIIGTPAAKESIFKSLIGKSLLESFDLGISEDTGPVAPNSPREELDQLYSELVRGLQSGLIVGPQAAEIDKLGPLVRKFQMDNPIGTGTTTGTDTSSGKINPHAGAASYNNTTPGDAKIGRENPGTRAYQNWLNAHGVKVAVDGKYGPETQNAGEKLPKEYRPASTDKAKRTEYEDMLGVGTAYNVIPGQGLSLNSPEYLEKMKKYGYDPKTGEKIGGEPAAPASGPAAPASGPAAPAASGNVPPQPTLNGKPSNGPKGQAWMKKYGATHNPDGTPKASASAPASPPASSSAPAPAADVSSAQKVAPPAKGAKPEEVTAYLKQVAPTPKTGDLYWVNGQRYKFTYNGRMGNKWETDDPVFTADRTTRSRTSNKYTGPDALSESGFTNDELNRIVSLVHYR